MQEKNCWGDSGKISNFIWKILSSKQKKFLHGVCFTLQDKPLKREDEKNTYLWANAPSLSLSPPYLYSCKVAPRPPCFITHMSTQSLNSSCKEYIDESPEIIIWQVRIYLYCQLTILISDGLIFLPNKMESRIRHAWVLLISQICYISRGGATVIRSTVQKRAQ